MPNKNLKTEPLLNDAEYDTLQTLINGSLLRPGERALIIVLVDLIERSKSQVALLEQILHSLQGKPAKVERAKI